MFLKDMSNGHLVEVLNVADLFNPFSTEVDGRYHYGEEAQEPEKFSKEILIFLSGENLPKCWVDPHYRDDQIKRKRIQA